MSEVPISWPEGPVFKHALAEEGPNGGLYRRDLADGASRWTPPESGNIWHLGYICPCGCKHMRMIPVTQDGSYGWAWDGDQVAPTLTPSILHTVSERSANCGWHGYLTAGVFKQV
jgi:hypothetical protein